MKFSWALANSFFGKLLTLSAMLAPILPAPQTVAAQEAAGAPQVRTLAGNGHIGIVDGPAATATFLLPTALTMDKGGALYILDRAAQRVRMLRNGIVSTVAGSGAIGPDGQSVLGGYRDGPAIEARFSSPDGIAAGPDGAVYIADSGNACIRKLAGGVVTTVLGKPGESRVVNGSMPDARLVDPRAIAFDSVGNLYIADYRGGLRLWSRDRRLTTIKLKSSVDDRYFGVTVARESGDDTVLLTTPEAVVVYRPRDGYTEAYRTTLAEGDRPFGYPDELAALDPRQFLFTDAQSNVVRYLRLPARPFRNTVFTRIIAGGTLERQVDNAGFRDGARADARFYAPAGIVIDKATAIVADAGNRRIRTVALPRTRTTEGGTADVGPVDSARYYEVAYIGSSTTFWDSLGDDSICARLEAALDAARIGRPVRCHHIRIDAASLSQIHSYITNYIVPRRMSLVIVPMTHEVVATMDGAPFKSVAALLAPFRLEIQTIRDELKTPQTKLVLIWNYAGLNVSAAEYFAGRESSPRLFELPVDAYPQFKSFVTPATQALAGLDVPVYDMYDDYIRYERSDNIAPLFNTTSDIHPNPRGNDFLAQAIARFLLSLPASAR